MGQDGAGQNRGCDTRRQSAQKGLGGAWDAMGEDVIARALTSGDGDFSRIFRVLLPQRAMQRRNASLVDHGV